MGHLVRVPVEILQLPDQTVESRDSDFIREDLREYCSLLDSLPVAWAVVDEHRITITSGMKYAVVARDLGHTHMSLLVSGELTPAALDHLSSVGATVSDVPREPEHVGPRGTELSWHVVGFDGGLSPSEREEFRSEMKSLFEASEDAIPVEVEFFGDAGRGARFRATTPTDDRGFAIALLAGLRRFHEAEHPILSYQGQRFSTYLPKAV